MFVFVKLSIPFEADEISNCMQEKDFANVKPVVELADNPNFHFLKDWDLFGPLILTIYANYTNCIVVLLHSFTVCKILIGVVVYSLICSSFSSGWLG